MRLQLAQLQSELEALQQELVATGAAAPAGGGTEVAGGGQRAARLSAVDGAGGGAGSGPLSLADALKELGQWQRRVQDMEAQLDEVRTGRRVPHGRHILPPSERPQLPSLPAHHCSPHRHTHHHRNHHHTHHCTHRTTPAACRRPSSGTWPCPAWMS